MTTLTKTIKAASAATEPTSKPTASKPRAAATSTRKATRKLPTTVVVEIPARIIAACQAHGITPAAFVRCLTEDAFEDLAHAQELMHALWPHRPANNGKPLFVSSGGLATGHRTGNN